MKRLFKILCRQLLRSSIAIATLALPFAINCLAQSTNIDYPTPVSASEVSGKILARDLGDSRLTTHYYVFEGQQGDIFLNITASNLNGDIDIFTVDNLRPITKISIYSDAPFKDTGRAIYLRKPEKLILRVEGRTPNDDPASYVIKFEGSFVAMAASKSAPPEPKLPEINTPADSEVVVNSVGTIVKTNPKPKPPAKTKTTTTKSTTTAKKTTKPTSTPKPDTTARKENSKTKTDESGTPKPEVVVTDNTPPPTESTASTAAKTPAKSKKAPAKKETQTSGVRTVFSKKKTPPKETTPKEPPPPNPLENVHLIVLLKNGDRIEKPMSEVTRVNVDNKGMLTIVTKDGKTEKYSILDVAKMTIE